MSGAKKYIYTRLLSKVSSMYYDQNYNQQEIATRLQLSRSKVSRLLKQARQQGIVQITVASPNGNFLEAEKAMEQKYKLKEVLLIDTEEAASSKIVKRQLGSAAANYLHRTISKGDIIGVTWGTTLQAMIDAMHPQKIEHVNIVQSLGGVGPAEAKAHAADISRRLSLTLGGGLTLLPAPGIVGSVEAKEVLSSDRQVKGALNLFSQIDTLYVGIGALRTNPILHKDHVELSPERYQGILNSDAVGDIALRFFDIDGNEAQTPVKDLIIGISPDEISQIETVVGIAGGPEKVDAIKGALNGNFIDVLITDNHTAKTILAT